MIDLFTTNSIFPIPMIIILIAFILVLFNLRKKKKSIDPDCILFEEDLEYIQQNDPEFFNKICANIK